MFQTKKVQYALSKALIEWRIEKNLSQERLATLSGLSRQYISRLESCKQLPRLDSVLQLLLPLEKTFSDLGHALDASLREDEKFPAHMAAEKKPFWNEK
jgi:transcriptional regulator with XRE-family HTH domain